MINGEIVVTASEAMAVADTVIPAIRDRLREEAQRVISQSGSVSERSRQVTIMGDKQIQFKLLKKVMASCTAAGYERIALAVQQLETKVS